MVRGIYTATSGMLTAERDINVRGNNIANLSTAGFKQDRLVTTTFAEALAVRQDTRTTGEKINIGQVTRGKKALEIKTDFSQGALNLTERSLDFAIAGDGFFVIQSGKGEYDEEENPQGTYGGVYYTRNGQFQIDGEGYLITGAGDYVLDSSGDGIYVGTDNFNVDEFGNIYDSNGENIAAFGIFNPDDASLLIKKDTDIYSVLNEDYLPEDIGFTGTIRQNYVEQSNTDVASQMAGLITASRSFQSMSQIIKAIDAVIGRSISDVARV